jgi:hypothetical protein
MHQIFFIQEKIVSVEVSGQNIQITTDFVVSSGYVKRLKEETAKNDVLMNLLQHFDGNFSTIYDKEGKDRLTNYLPRVIFKTYEEGCKVLTTILAKRCSNDATIRETFDKLVKQYPEYAI